MSKISRIQDAQQEEKLLNQMNEARLGLYAFGWMHADFCPRDGTRFLAVESGSSRIYPCYCSVEFPKGIFFIEDGDGLWPSHPILWKPMPQEGETK